MHDADDDLYELLGVTPSATPEQISRAYRALVRRHHPDSRVRTGTGDDGTAHDRAIRAVMSAYAVLSDPVRRAAYDRSRRSTSGGAGRASGSRVGGGSGPGPNAGSRAAPRNDGIRIRVNVRDSTTTAPVAPTNAGSSSPGDAAARRAPTDPFIRVGPVFHTPPGMTAYPPGPSGGRPAGSTGESETDRLAALLRAWLRGW